jgi:hypothetical protein
MQQKNLAGCVMAWEWRCATAWASFSGRSVMTRHRLVALPLLVFVLGAVALAARGTGAQGEQYDLVLVGGRVLDPETALDASIVREEGFDRYGRPAKVCFEVEEF